MCRNAIGCARDKPDEDLALRRGQLAILKLTVAFRSQEGFGPVDFAGLSLARCQVDLGLKIFWFNLEEQVPETRGAMPMMLARTWSSPVQGV